jgi:hypothetical protein
MIRGNRSVSILGIFLLAAFAFSAVASATTLMRMDLKTLALSAQVISRARCIRSETRWESGSIWTFDEFEVLESFKGSPPRVLRIRLPGGRMGHLETKIDGVPHFSPGEEAVLFLQKTSAGDFGVTSWAQGTFRVHRESAAGDARVTQDTSRFAVFDPATRRFVFAGIRDLSLSAFRRQLADALKSSEGIGREN